MLIYLFLGVEGITSNIFFYMLNFPKIRVRLKMTLSFLFPLTNLLYDGLLRLQILFI